MDEAEAITTDVTDAPLRWKRGAVAGKAVRFEVRLNHARLYAISGVDLVHAEMKKPSQSSDASGRTPHPISSKSLSFNDDVQGWKGVDKIEHHRDGGAKRGLSASPAAVARCPLPCRLPPRRTLPRWRLEDAGRWKGARITCQVRSAKAAGRVVIEIFARDIAQWSIETNAPITNDWTQALAALRYDWSDEEAKAAG